MRIRIHITVLSTGILKRLLADGNFVQASEHYQVYIYFSQLSFDRQRADAAQPSHVCGAAVSRGKYPSAGPQWAGRSDQRGRGLSRPHAGH